LTVSNPKEEQEEKHDMWKQLELEFED
jgi:hypothetical protein